MAYVRPTLTDVAARGANQSGILLCGVSTSTCSTNQASSSSPTPESSPPPTLIDHRWIQSQGIAFAMTRPAVLLDFTWSFRQGISFSRPDGQRRKYVDFPRPRTPQPAPRPRPGQVPPANQHFLGPGAVPDPGFQALESSALIGKLKMEVQQLKAKAEALRTQVTKLSAELRGAREARDVAQQEHKSEQIGNRRVDLELAQALEQCRRATSELEGERRTRQQLEAQHNSEIAKGVELGIYASRTKLEAAKNTADRRALEEEGRRKVAEEERERSEKSEDAIRQRNKTLETTLKEERRQLASESQALKVKLREELYRVRRGLEERKPARSTYAGLRETTHRNFRSLRVEFAAEVKALREDVGSSVAHLRQLHDAHGHLASTRFPAGQEDHRHDAIVDLLRLKRQHAQDSLASLAGFCDRTIRLNMDLDMVSHNSREIMRTTRDQASENVVPVVAQGGMAHAMRVLRDEVTRFQQEMIEIQEAIPRANDTDKQKLRSHESRLRVAIQCYVSVSRIARLLSEIEVRRGILPLSLEKKAVSTRLLNTKTRQILRFLQRVKHTGVRLSGQVVDQLRDGAMAPEAQHRTYLGQKMVLLKLAERGRDEEKAIDERLRHEIDQLRLELNGELIRPTKTNTVVRPIQTSGRGSRTIAIKKTSASSMIPTTNSRDGSRKRQRRLNFKPTEHKKASAAQSAASTRSTRALLSIASYQVNESSERPHTAFESVSTKPDNSEVYELDEVPSTSQKTSTSSVPSCTDVNTAVTLAQSLDPANRSGVSIEANLEAIDTSLHPSEAKMAVCGTTVEPVGTPHALPDFTPPIGLTYQTLAKDHASASSAPAAPNMPFWSFKNYQSESGKPPAVHYCKTHETAEVQAAAFLDEPIIGFDLEWEEYSRSDRDSIKRCVSLVQIASESKIGLFHVALFKGESADDLMPPNLRRLLETSEILKAGVNVAGDSRRLEKCFGVKMQGLFELSHLYKVIMFGEKEPWKVDRKPFKLAEQVQNVLHLPLPKGEVRTSAWSRSLSPQQVDYAASDAYAGFQLFHALEARRRAMDPMPPCPAPWDAKQPLVLGDGTMIVSRTSRRKSAMSGKEHKLVEEDEERDGFFDALETQNAREDFDRSKSQVDDDSTRLTATLLASSDLGRERSNSSFVERTVETSDVSPADLAASKPKVIRPSSPEVTQANAWIGEWRASARGKSRLHVGDSSLRTYHLWHTQGLDLEMTASLLRDPPLAMSTVAKYIIEVVARENLPYNPERLKEPFRVLPGTVHWRYHGLLTKLGM